MVWKITQWVLIAWTVCGFLIFDKVPHFAILLCLLAWALFYRLRPAVFKIVPYYEHYRVVYKGVTWFENFESVNKASNRIMIYCGDSNIKNYKIISPNGVDIT